MLTKIEKWQILQQEYSWGESNRNKFYNLSEAIHRLDNIDKEDLISEFYQHIIDKEIKYKAGLITSLLNYCKNKYGKLQKNKNKEFDKYILEQYRRLLPDIELSDYDSKYLSWFIARQDCPKINPIVFGLSNLIITGSKGRNEGRRNRILRKKVIKHNYIYIVSLYRNVYNELDSYDLMFVEMCRDTLVGNSTSKYSSVINVFTETIHGTLVKEYKQVSESSRILLKILNKMGV